MVEISKQWKLEGKEIVKGGSNTSGKTAGAHSAGHLNTRSELQRPRLAKVVHVVCILVIIAIAYAYRSHVFKVLKHVIHIRLIVAMIPVGCKFLRLPTEKAKLYSSNLDWYIWSMRFNMHKTTLRDFHDSTRLCCYALDRYSTYRQFLNMVFQLERAFFDMILLKDTFSSRHTFSCPHSMVRNAIIGIIIGKSSLIVYRTIMLTVYKAGWVAAKGHSASHVEAYALATTQSSPTRGGGNWMPALWLDSGAAQHVVGDTRILTNLRDPPVGITVTVEDGFRLAVRKVGDIQTPYFEIEDVYLVPELQTNLVSVRQLARRQIITTFYEHHAVLKHGLDEIGGAIADDETSLYRLRYLTANLP